MWVVDAVELPAPVAASGDDSGGAQLGQLLAGGGDGGAGELGQRGHVEFVGGEQPDQMQPARDGEQIEGRGGGVELSVGDTDRLRRRGSGVAGVQARG